MKTTTMSIRVVFMFTKPLVTLLARTKFFGQGHPLSGLSPDRLGAPKRTLTTRPSSRRPAVATRVTPKEAS